MPCTGRHDPASAAVPPNLRLRTLAAQGYVVLRFTWRQVFDASVLVVTRVAQALAVRDGNVRRAR